MMPPEKMAELGHAMSAALAAAVAANPNDHVAVHRALWDEKLARIAALEAALRSARSQLVTLVGEALHAHGDMVQRAALAEIDAALTGKG